MRKVLILGGTGRMSSELTALCLANGDDVTIASRGKHKLNDVISSVNTIVFDRNDENATKSSLKNSFYDVVFDCAGYTPQSVDWVLSSVKTNRYIYISTIGTYAHYKSGFNLKEEELPIIGKEYDGNIKEGEVAWYPRAKYNSELLIANKYPGLNYAIVRIPFVMSLNEDYDDKLASRVLEYVSAVINSIPINEKGIDRRFSFVLNTDEAKFLMFLAESNYKGVINFASQGDISMRDVITYIENKTGEKAILTIGEMYYLPFTMHPEVVMNLDKCTKTLSYTPINLQEWFTKKLDIYIDHCLKLKNTEIKSNLGSFKGIKNLNPLQYESIQHHFRFDENFWEEHFMNGHTVLLTKSEKSPPGKLAVMPFRDKLTEGKKYSIYIRFKVNSKSPEFNLQVVDVDMPKQKLQLLHRCKSASGFSDEWIEVHVEFIAKSDFNGFGIGAAQLIGKSAYFMIDYIYIIKE